MKKMKKKKIFNKFYITEISAIEYEIYMKINKIVSRPLNYVFEWRGKYWLVVE